MSGVRLLLTALLATLVAAAPAGAKPRASVDVTACRGSLDPELRVAAFEGAMRQVPGGERMEMRFTLRERPAAQRWRSLDAEGWDAWVGSDPGVVEYHYTRQVAGLAAPAAYRTVVRFRWLDAAGAVLARRKVTSEVCRQHDLRPDLHVAEAAFRDGAWRVRLRNEGRTAAGPSTLVVQVGAVEREVLVRSVKAGQDRTIDVLAPPCRAGQSLRAAADAEGAVDERDEGDNVLSRGC